MFNLVVTCVGSKKIKRPSIKDAINRLKDDVIVDDVDALFEEWSGTLRSELNSSALRMGALSLYKGGMWNASKNAFFNIKKPRKLWIISCGYGFINFKNDITGYAATFKSSEVDSIFDRRIFPSVKEDEMKRQWWDKLTRNPILENDQPKSIHELVNGSEPDDIIMIVAGKDYYKAIYDDLDRIEVSEDLPKLILLGIKRTYKGFEPKVPYKLEPFIQSYSDGTKLREFHGCAGTQVHPKSAEFLIKQYYENGKLEYKFP